VSALIGIGALGASAPAEAGLLDMPVVGGKLVKPGDWPDVVAVFTEDGGLCSGTLLGADLVLTAGHCIGGHPVEVIVGSVDLAQSGGQRRAVKWSKVYPNWEYRYDVGVVMLEHPVSVKQRAIAENCASGKRNRLVPGTRLDVVGFGLTTKTATDNNTRLHAASLEVVDGLCERDRSCKEAVAPGGEFTAGGHGADACFGDSGGPVYIGTSHGPALIGVVSRGLASWGDPCGEGGVFVRADKVAAWIEEVTRRKVDRVECDLPADDGTGGEVGDGNSTGGSSDGAGPGDGGGCYAAGGALESGLVLVYGLFCAASLRLSRLRRLAEGRRAKPLHFGPKGE
jgi:secreted trypsin-like serine protease